MNPSHLDIVLLCLLAALPSCCRRDAAQSTPVRADATSAAPAAADAGAPPATHAASIE